MRVERNWLRRVIFDVDDGRRYTQDSPILPDVWLSAGAEYCSDPDARVDLILTPYKDYPPSELARRLGKRLRRLRTLALDRRMTDPTVPVPSSPKDEAGPPMLRSMDDTRVIRRSSWMLSVNQTNVVVSLTLTELIAAVLPLSPWWERNVLQVSEPATSKEMDTPDKERAKRKTKEDSREAERRWMMKIIGVLVLCAQWTPSQESSNVTDNDGRPADERRRTRADDEALRAFEDIVLRTEAHEKIFADLVDLSKQLSDPDLVKLTKQPPPPEVVLWSVSLNRRASTAIERSVVATKADAARSVFNIRCKDLVWAIVDSGIDAEHVAFRDPEQPENKGRVKAVYDFTKLRRILSLDSDPTVGPSSADADIDLEDADRRAKRVRERIRSGQALDWASLEPLLNISKGTPGYSTPKNDHGTHVAGILGANADPYVGMCPDIQLYDLRVLDENGRGDEFSIIAALQFIRYLNSVADRQVINGVNLSLSLVHDVENYACGRTPICDECERLVHSGVIVVAAAGNRGYERVLTIAGEIDAYRSISITDPGNAELIITVGATHRFEPHTYGVSYFSSRGPTGDGRIKPDIVAPGERIYSALPNGRYGPKDGTSMAAPHVSGVAALLVARHPEFLGKPGEIKRILCETATSLKREPYFQGAGMVDAFRALQRV